MAKTCECGHCLHETIVETKLVDPGTGLSYIRKTCADCSVWFGDQFVDEPKPKAA